MIAGRLPTAFRIFPETIVLPAAVPGTLYATTVTVNGLTGNEVVSVNNPVGAGVSVTAWSQPNEIYVQLVYNIGWAGGPSNFIFSVVVV